MNDSLSSKVDERLLVEHLLREVTLGLSGRDGADIIDFPPVRSCFAGVLEPVREHSASSQVTSGTSAIGLDFRVRARKTHEPVSLRIEATWAHYFAVFPTWDQLSVDRFSGPEATTTVQSSRSPVTTVAENADGEPEAEPSEAEEFVPPQIDVPGSPTIDSMESQRRRLPRVFSRLDTGVGPIEVVLTQVPTEMEVGNTETAAAVTTVFDAIKGSPRAWRHLAEPEKNERSLSGDIHSEESYLVALRNVKGPRVTQPSWRVRITVDAAPDPALEGITRVRVLLENRTPSREEAPNQSPGQRATLIEPDSLLQERALFDALLSITVANADIIPFDFLLAPSDYRNKPQMPGKGINCVAVLTDRPNQLVTEALPVFRQAHYRTRDSLQVPFGTLKDGGFRTALERIDGAMVEYLRQWDSFLTVEAPTQLTEDGRQACATDRERFREELQRFRLGVSSLEHDERLAKAFQLMNKAFERLAVASGGRVKAWRLFQIGFIVSQLPALAVRELTPADTDPFAEDLRNAHAEVGILWFPTGGGKTEAYLGLVATALIFDRLRGKSRGVSTWMRFPLRMLSLQQLDRLARVLAALEILRSQTPEISHGDPFAIGYFVGDGVTPNSISEEEMKKLERESRYREEKRLIRKCPFCEHPVEMRAQRKDWRLAHVCTNSSCFSNTSNGLGPFKGSLPLCIVDNEIYRYLPAVLVGTIDKLAIVGRSRHFSQIVRGVSQQCKNHGYTSYDECIEHWAGCKAKKRDLVKLSPVKDPGISILIQDEFHLLRAELGVFNGHYEGLLRYLGQKAHLAPKVLAATATIEAYDVHAFHIYLSRSRRFPQPSWTEGESFYATSTPHKERRFYVGIRSHTRAVEDPIIRITTLYQIALRRLQTNPRAAAAILMQEALTDDEVQDLLRLYDLSLIYVNRKATGGSILDKLSRTDRQLQAKGFVVNRHQLLTGDQRVEDIASAIDQIEREREHTGEQRLDVVIATNLISHGVDLERINMMAVAGMPSHYAEYVQASSRAARAHPGIVFVCFKSRDPRESSQYEFFPAMHQNMDRLVEAVAVNRFATFAPQKTIPGLLSGLLLCALSPDLFVNGTISRSLDYLPALKTALGIGPGHTTGSASAVSEEFLRNALYQIIGVDQVRPPASPSQIANVKRQVDVSITENLELIGRGLDNQLKNVLNPITSFRDVDEGIDFSSIESASLVTRLRAY